MLKKKDFKFSCILHLTHSKFEHSPSLCHFTSFPLHCRFFSAPGINKSGPLSPTSSLRVLPSPWLRMRSLTQPGKKTTDEAREFDIQKRAREKEEQNHRLVEFPKPKGASIYDVFTKVWNFYLPSNLSAEVTVCTEGGGLSVAGFQR